MGPPSPAVSTICLCLTQHLHILVNTQLQSLFSLLTEDDE